MLRSWRGDRKCILLSIVILLLTALSINFVSSYFSSNNPCPYCSGDTPKNYCLTVEEVKNCADDSLSELNGEYELTQGDSCTWGYSGNDYVSSIMLIADNWENDGGFGISVIPYTPYGDTMYFKFYPNLCTETMESDIRKEHSICDSPGNPDNIYGGKATLAPCKTPEIKNLTIYPEYDSEKYTNRTNLAYEEIFPDNKLKPYINLTIIYSDGSIPRDDEKFNVSYTIEFHYPLELEAKHPGLYKKLPENSTNCSKNCRIEIPEEDVDQDTLIEVTAYTSNWRKTKTGYRQTPVFDIIAESIDAGNVLFGLNDLVENKPIATRANVKIYSYLRKMGNQPIDFYMNYIDSIEDISVDFIVDGTKEMNSKEKLVNYGDIEELKQKVVNTLLSVDERRKAMETLNAIHKKAKDTRNFIGYIPKGKTGSIALKVALDNINGINEFNKKNNNFSKTCNLRQQKDSNFKFAFSGMNMKIKSGSFTVKDYNEEKIIMNESYNFIKSAFPFDPTKVSVRVAANPGLLKGNLGFLPDPAIDLMTLEGLQKTADINGFDMIFGVIPSGAADLIKAGMAGETVNIYKNAAIIPEGYDYNSYAHEAGHLFGLYTEEEQKAGICDEEKDLGLLSSNGWCMNQETGESCARFVSCIPMGINGEVISVWDDRDGTQGGCYSGEDGPYWHHQLPFDLKYLSPQRKFDIMANAHNAWPTQNPTYNKLMEKILA